MFGLGWPEILVILVIALVVLGPRKLPEVAKGLGKAFAELRRTTDEMRDSIDLEIRKADEAVRLEAARARAKQRETKAAGTGTAPAAGTAPPIEPAQAYGAIPASSEAAPSTAGVAHASSPAAPTPPSAAGPTPAPPPPGGVEKPEKEEGGSGR